MSLFARKFIRELKHWTDLISRLKSLYYFCIMALSSQHSLGTLWTNHVLITISYRLFSLCLVRMWSPERTKTRTPQFHGPALFIFLILDVRTFGNSPLGPR
jgi:hypothetical protein